MEGIEMEWECFSDPSHYDMWCVRPVGERTFGAGYHLMRQEEAEHLRDRLTGYATTLRQIADSGNSINAHLAAQALGDGK